MMKPRACEKKSVVIVARVVPHYRVGFLNRLEQRLSRLGIELTVFSDYVRPGTFHLEGLTQVSCAIRVPNHYLNFVEQLTGMRTPYWQPLLSRLNAFDLVIVEQSNAALLNYPLFLRRAAKGSPKVAFWGHGANFQTSDVALQRWLKSMFFSLADHWFVFTDLSADLVRGRGVPNQIITVVNNSFDISDFARVSNMDSAERQNARSQVGLGPGPVAAFCARLVERKALPFVVEACRLARRRVRDLNLLVIGEGPYGPWLQEQTKKNPWIRPVGALYGAEKARALFISDVFLLPSMVGLSILDGFAAELPVLVARFNNHSPEVAYFQDGVNGLMTDATTESYATAIHDILSDRATRERMAAAARESARIYSVDAMVKNFARGVEQVLGQP